MTRAFVLIPLAVALALGAIFLMRLENPKDPTVIASPLIGKPAPVMDLPGVGGGPGIGPGDLKDGRVKLVNFWASWCGPCRVEHPYLIALAKEVPVYGVNYSERDPKAGEAFLAELGNPFERVGADPKGLAAVQWGLTGVPETYVVDGAGTIVAKHAGPIDEEVWQNVLKPAIEGAQAPRR